ncbi:hypothetical protein [Reinekea marinisedimentorum]|uniref:Uncharacterized protein n=1 Tax=Reinekea marinisedimentorum TaxID=230495 RepID=A0A4V2UJV3_9GAMM|nr:hypothetical protein [Reinekea marinisedimentorum]TCS41618.1 hypothetical protein BCF53_10545 [Reinekea marinisedimentorum]
MSKHNPPKTVSLSKLYENRKASTDAPTSIEKKVLAQIKTGDEKTNRRYRFLAEAIVGIIIFIIVLPHGLQVNNEPAVEPMSMTELLATVQEAKPKVSEQLVTAPAAKEAQPAAERSFSATMQADTEMAENELTITTEPALVAADEVAPPAVNTAKALSAAAETTEPLVLLVVDGSAGTFTDCNNQTITLPVQTKLTGWVKATLGDEQNWSLEATEKPDNCQIEME